MVLINLKVGETCRNTAMREEKRLKNGSAWIILPQEKTEGHNLSWLEEKGVSSI